MWPAANFLTNSRKILYLIQKDSFQLSLCGNYEKLAYKFVGADFTSALDPWTRSLLKSALEQELLSIQVSTYFGGSNFQNIWTIQLILAF